MTGVPHRDPFDRMLLSVSSCLGVPLVTADRVLLASSVSPSVDLIDARR